VSKEETRHVPFDSVAIEFCEQVAGRRGVLAKNTIIGKDLRSMRLRRLTFFDNKFDTADAISAEGRE
jgi:hypothetical protein